MSDTDTRAGEALTVAEAAELLGVSERHLRRLLARPENAARTVARTRTTRTGTRRATVLPADLVADLQACAEREEAPAENADSNGGKNADNADSGAALTTTRVAAIYERLIAEKDARLADQSARISALEEALTRSQDALAREQALRALPPAPMPRRSWWPWKRSKSNG